MGLYGPFTAVAGKIMECDMAQDVAALYIRNITIYDLAVSFSSQRPANNANTTFGGPPWYAVIPAGDRVGIRIPAGVYGGEGFPGYVWVLPINNTTSLALTGTASNNVIFYIETYADAALLPSDYASAQFQNAASQQRVIAVPFGVFPVRGRTSPSANSNIIIVAQACTQNQLTNQVVIVYIYNLLITMGHFGAASGLQGTLDVYSLKNDLTTIVDGPFSLIGYNLWAGTTATPQNGILNLAPPHPYVKAIDLTRVAGAAAWGARLNISAIAGTPQIDWVASVDCDNTNAQTSGDIGNSTTTLAGAANNPGLY